MTRIVLGRALIAAVLGVASPAADGPAVAPPLGGRLAGAVLLLEQPLTTADIPQDLSSADRMRLGAYLVRWRGFRTSQGAIAGSVETWKRRERLEREIASILERPGIEQAAYGIAWSQGPFGLTDGVDADAEAQWAERLLRDPANAAASPYLYAFLASRYRLQLERAPEDREALERLARKYRTMLHRVKGSGDAIFLLLADDLDGRASLGAGAARHPRQYLPDT